MILSHYFPTPFIFVSNTFRLKQFPVGIFRGHDISRGNIFGYIIAPPRARVVQTENRPTEWRRRRAETNETANQSYWIPVENPCSSERAVTAVMFPRTWNDKTTLYESMSRRLSTLNVCTRTTVSYYVFFLNTPSAAVSRFRPEPFLFVRSPPRSLRNNYFLHFRCTYSNYFFFSFR